MSSGVIFTKHLKSKLKIIKIFFKPKHLYFCLKMTYFCIKEMFYECILHRFNSFQYKIPNEWNMSNWNFHLFFNLICFVNTAPGVEIFLKLFITLYYITVSLSHLIACFACLWVNKWICVCTLYMFYWISVCMPMGVFVNLCVRTYACIIELVSACLWVYLWICVYKPMHVLLNLYVHALYVLLN